MINRNENENGNDNGNGKIDHKNIDQDIDRDKYTKYIVSQYVSLCNKQHLSSISGLIY